MSFVQQFHKQPMFWCISPIKMVYLGMADPIALLKLLENYEPTSTMAP